MSRLYQPALALIFLTMSQLSFGQLKVSRLFSDHAVLQRQKPVSVWGGARAGEQIRVNFAGQTQTALADADGKWRVALSPMEAGGPYDMTIIAARDSIKITDLLVGEVWLCSGQSNMEWTVHNTQNYKEERKNSNLPQIRQFKVDQKVSFEPEKQLTSGSWKICSPETVGDFTGVGYFFAKELFQRLNVPVGLVHSSWGGSQIEGWISRDAMATSEDFRDYAQNFPTSWDAADVHLERSIKNKLFGSPDRVVTAEDEKRYIRADYDFSNWLSSDPLGQWDWKGIWAWRGNGYMGRMVDIPAEMTSQFTTLGLAESYSYNEVYINGKLVYAGTQKGPRKLILQPNTWTAGANKLMIKMNKAIEPEWFGVGMQGVPDDLFVSAGDQKISLYDSPWKLMPSFSEPHTYARSSNNVGATIYNGMIAPLVPYAIRGALWYQGESNASRAYQYRKAFPLMIQDWRNKWNDPFAFYFVQLSSYGSDQNSNEGSNWAELREAQTQALSLPATGMAVTIDIGNPLNIHPINKQDVGKRLAASALKNTYGIDVIPSGPMYAGSSFENGKAVVSFKYVGKGLVAKDKFGYLKGFEVAGADKVFYYAKAEISGDKVIVYHPKGMRPVSVRYAWSDAPVDANLFNVDGFPACPFRTDDWPGKTVKEKFE